MPGNIFYEALMSLAVKDYFDYYSRGWPPDRRLNRTL
jgi:hypothetical protein